MLISQSNPHFISRALQTFQTSKISYRNPWITLGVKMLTPQPTHPLLSQAFQTLEISKWSPGFRGKNLQKSAFLKFMSQAGHVRQIFKISGEELQLNSAKWPTNALSPNVRRSLKSFREACKKWQKILTTHPGFAKRAGKYRGPHTEHQLQWPRSVVPAGK